MALPVPYRNGSGHFFQHNDSILATFGIGVFVIKLLSTLRRTNTMVECSQVTNGVLCGLLLPHPSRGLRSVSFLPQRAYLGGCPNLRKALEASGEMRAPTQNITWLCLQLIPLILETKEKLMFRNPKGF